jgi:hypothetical protein
VRYNPYTQRVEILDSLLAVHGLVREIKCNFGLCLACFAHIKLIFRSSDYAGGLVEEDGDWGTLKPTRRDGRQNQKIAHSVYSFPYNANTIYELCSKLSYW